MGNKSSSSSKTKQDITNNTINQDIVDSLNESIMNVSTNTLINNASTCSSSISQNNLCKLEVGNVTGDFNVGGPQSNVNKVDFSCVQGSSAAGDMSSSMIQNLISQMNSLNGTENAAALNSAANSAANTGSLATGNVSGSSSTNVKVSNNVTNETISYVQNLFEQNLNNNFSSETVNQCIGKNTQSNTQDIAAGNVEGTVNVNCIQTNNIEQVQNCEQLSEAINKTVGSTLSELGLSVISESTTSSATESTATSESSATATGVIQDTGTAISGIIDSIGGILGELGSYWLYIALCIGCVVLLVGIYFISSGGSFSADSQGNVSLKTHSGGRWGWGEDSSSFLSDSSLSLSSGSRTSDTNFTYYNVPESLISDTSINSKALILTPNLIFTL